MEEQIYHICTAQPDGVQHAKKVSVRVAAALSAMIDGFWLQALLYPKTFKAKDAIRSCLAFVKLLDLYYDQSQQLAVLEKRSKEQVKE